MRPQAVHLLHAKTLHQFILGGRLGEIIPPWSFADRIAAESREPCRWFQTNQPGHLEMDGHRVSVAFDGKSGLECVLREQPDLAIMDIGIPELNGDEVAKQVRKHDAGKDIFLVALTGYGQPADVTRAKESGFNAHLVKPLDLTRLRELLSKPQANL